MPPVENQTGSRIAATGRCIPENVVFSSETEIHCGLEKGWIEKRTGIRQRPIVSSDQSVSDLAIIAGRKALLGYADQRIRPSPQVPIGHLILATSTPDHLLPPTAPYVAQRLELGNIPAMDLAVACSGFLYALQLADFICRSTNKGVMVIAANVLSKRLANDDPVTASLFADGAGATIVEPATEHGILDIQLESDGSGYEALLIPDGGSRNPISETTYQDKAHLMKVNNGMAVFRYAVESMARLGQQVMDQVGWNAADIDLWVPHQANLRIIDSVRQRLKIASDKSAVTIDQFANSSAATIPIALDYMIENGRLHRGDRLLLTAAAAGMTCGAAALQW